MLTEYEIKLMEAFGVPKLFCKGYVTNCGRKGGCDGFWDNGLPCPYHTNIGQYPNEITEIQWLRMYACYMSWFMSEIFADVTIDPYEMTEESKEQFVKALLTCPKPDDFVKQIRHILTNTMHLYRWEK